MEKKEREEIIRKLVQEEGFELYAYRYTPGKKGARLYIAIDLVERRIDLSDCERVGRNGKNRFERTPRKAKCVHRPPFQGISRGAADRDRREGLHPQLHHRIRPDKKGEPLPGGMMV